MTKSRPAMHYVLGALIVIGVIEYADLIYRFV